MPSEIPSEARTKAIYFDAAGTLIKPARRVGESYAAIAVKYGKNVSPSELFAEIYSRLGARVRRFVRSGSLGKS